MFPPLILFVNINPGFSDKTYLLKATRIQSDLKYLSSTNSSPLTSNVSSGISKINGSYNSTHSIRTLKGANGTVSDKEQL